MGSNTLTPERVREVLRYVKSSGLFYWRVHNGKCRPGTLAGTSLNSGHLVIRIDNKLCLAHRLAWVIVNGVWPTETIDHRDRCPSNNRWKNLREASVAEQVYNRVTRPGRYLRGTWPLRGKWQARIKINYKLRSLGVYSTEQEAHTVYCAALKKYHREFAFSG